MSFACINNTRLSGRFNALGFGQVREMDNCNGH